MRFPIFTSLIQLLFPLRCRRCKTPGTALCTLCVHTIRLATDLPEKTYAVFDYGNPIVRGAIRDLKYHAHSETARALANHAVPYIIEYLSEEIQSIRTQSIVLTAIPTHSQKLHARGFNQSILLAQWWSEQIPGANLLPLLHKTRHTSPQAHLTRKKRLQNVVGSMHCTHSLDPKVLYIVVDDVITTGATSTEARRALKAAGARKIHTIALAHGYVHT